MLGELLPCGGGDSIPLLRKKLLIGRRSACDILLNYPNVSSQHCELELQNGYWHVRDLNSSNGIKVNGERCDQKFLMPGDELTVAKHHFVISYQPMGDAPAPVEEEDPFAMSLLEKAGLQQRREERRRRPPAPAARPPAPQKKFSAEEDAALQWLTDE
ncbi:MAG: FHA domain-containing protein [Planctomycetaceae bacterium]|nr:FHA domain-containing protein [Planctomycetaceae bacterium]MCA9044478.1 FHA domain-containing protein [Planctomycetaceae bacterium]MCB9952975.1 FHA domain-containing protein [Planctomycetaceae bacterium]